MRVGLTMHGSSFKDVHFVRLATRSKGLLKLLHTINPCLKKAELYFILFLLRWYLARYLFGPQILVTVGGFKMQISYIGSSYLTH